jgi:signal transduction histidine kinase/CheY-like chemotaxis protein
MATNGARDDDGAMAMETRVELIRLLQRQLPVVLAVNVVNALLVAALLAPAGGLVVWQWAGLVLSVTAVRGLIWQRQRRRSIRRENAALVRVVQVGGSAISGLLWGVGAVWLFPSEPVYQMFLTFVIAGMAAGAVATLSAVPPAFYAYTLTAVLPLAARLFAEGAPVYLVMAAMAVVFAAALSLIAYIHYRSLRDAFRLRLNLAQRSSELAKANARLSAEIETRRRAEETLRQAAKMEAVGQLTSGIAHDFNNLLTTIIGSHQLILDVPETNDRIRRLLGMAQRAADHGAQLVNQLLTFSHRRPLVPEILTVNDLLMRPDAFWRQAIGSDLELLLVLADDLWRAFIDPVQFETVMLNLVLNAADAMRERGRVTITTRNVCLSAADARHVPPGYYVCLLVQDTGAGMSPEIAARAFEPFFTSKKLGKGSGLGLSMTYSFAVQSGGTAEIDSAPGRGTTVALYFPRAKDGGVTARVDIAPDEPVAPDARARAATILLVDDEELVRQISADELSETGHYVLEAGSAPDALALLRGGEPVDLVVTDVAMPGGMNGVELAEEVRRLWRDLPVLLITGYDLRLAQSQDVGFPVLRKPYRPSELRAKVQEILTERARHRESGALPLDASRA